MLTIITRGKNAMRVPKNHLGSQGAKLLAISDDIASNKSVTDICALLMGLVGFIIFLLIWQGNPSLVQHVTKEDGLIENLSALFWLEASVICFYRIATSPQDNKILLYFWGIFCFLCFGEEISWGQRIFSYSVNAIQGINLQNEINIHNIVAFNKGSGIFVLLKTGDWSKLNLSWKFIFNMKRLFYVGFFMYFFIMPLLLRRDKYKYLQNKFHFTNPSNYFLIAVWPNIILFEFMSLILNNDPLSETDEMFMAFAVLFYVVFYLYYNPYRNLEMNPKALQES
jgi:hypothetical protein